MFIDRNIEFFKISQLNIEKALNIKGYNQFDLCKHYIDYFRNIGIPMKSCLRSNDENNSLNTCIGKLGDILISDFGYRIGMTIYKFVAIKYFDESNLGFIKGLNKIIKDFNLEGFEEPNFKYSNVSNTISTPRKHNYNVEVNNLPVTIYTKGRAWELRDIDYWKSHGVSISKLEEKNHTAIEKFRIINPNKNKDTTILTTNDLAYKYYLEQDSANRYIYKLYLPLGLKGDKNFKWFSNADKTVIQNEKFIDETGELLIIQSSYKDTMLMEELGYKNIVAPSSESSFIPIDKLNNYKNRFGKIVYFGNNDFTKKDNSGLKFCRKWSLLYNISYITTPDFTASDISDYYKKYGRCKTKFLIDKLINNILK